MYFLPAGAGLFVGSHNTLLCLMVSLPFHLSYIYLYQSQSAFIVVVDVHYSCCTLCFSSHIYSLLLINNNPIMHFICWLTGGIFCKLNQSALSSIHCVSCATHINLAKYCLPTQMTFIVFLCSKIPNI